MAPDTKNSHRCTRNLRFAVIFLCASIITGEAYIIRKGTTPSKWADNEEIQIFREYLRIPTVHPNIDYRPAVNFLEKQATSLDLPISIHYPVDKENPVVVMTLEGSEPELPSIMLNSHMDVVPAIEEYWTYKPFAAEITENGDIFARGAQDMKCVGTQYLAAIRALKRQGVNQFKRTVYIVFVPDEEVGGTLGMVGFIKSNAFKAMNVGFVLDEGMVTVDGISPAYYVERTIWQTEFTFHGQSGHASLLFDNTPGEKLNYVFGKLTEYRKEEKRKLQELNYPYGNVTSINLTILKGGIQNNVVPAEMKAIFDMRISVNTDLDEFEQMLDRWCEEAGGGITRKGLVHGEKEKATVVDDSNQYWVALKNGATNAGLKVEPAIMGPSSDMRYVRRMNIPAIGFSPLVDTVTKMHDHDEYINADVYLAGIEVYQKIIPSLGDA